MQWISLYDGALIDDTHQSDLSELTVQRGESKLLAAFEQMERAHSHVPDGPATRVQPASRTRWRELGEVLKDGIGNAELVRFEDSGHGLFYKEKETFTNELLDLAE